MVMENSIEERMITLQQSKTALGDGSLRKLSAEERKKARITALKGRLFMCSSDIPCIFFMLVVRILIILLAASIRFSFAFCGYRSLSGSESRRHLEGLVW